MPRMLDALLGLLKGESSETIVWTADLSYWISGRLEDGTAEAAWNEEEGYLRLHQELGVMPYYYYPRFWVGKPVYDGKVAERTETDGGITAHVWTTPAGTLRQESKYIKESACGAITRHPVQSEEDLDILLHLLERRRLEPVNLADYPARMDLWRAYGGIPCLGLPRSPLASFVYEWAGVQNAVYLLMDCQEKVEDVLRLLEEQEAPVLEAVCELAPPLVHFPDNLSSENLTGYYDAYMGPAHQRRLEKLHAAGTKAAVHLDGTVKGLLPKLVRSGFDAVEALTPQPAGDLTLAEIRDVAQSETVLLWGGMPGALFAPPYTWADVEKHLHRLLEAWNGRPFVIGVADQVPPDGEIDYCRRIGECLRSLKH